MSLSTTNNPMSPADFKALLGNQNDDGMNANGNWFIWIIVLFLFAMLGGVNNNNGGGNAQVTPVAVPMNYGGSPYTTDAITGAAVQRGFDQASIMNALGDISIGQVNGFAGTQQAMCAGFGGVNAAVRDGFASAEIGANARQMALMQQDFNAQIASMQAFNALQAALDRCCCDNRAATADLKYTVATEACADRAAVGDALQNVTMQGVNNTNLLLTTMNQGFQGIKDQMCQDKIDAKDDLISQLRSELMYARGQASQDNQTAALSLGQRNLEAAIEQYLNQKFGNCNCSYGQSY